jgi:hypothetical protein
MEEPCAGKLLARGLWGSGEATNRPTLNQEKEELILVFKLKPFIVNLKRKE